MVEGNKARIRLQPQIVRAGVVMLSAVEVVVVCFGVLMWRKGRVLQCVAGGVFSFGV